MNSDISVESIFWFGLVTGVCGGRALFLYGLGKVTSALKRVAGSRMKKILASLTVQIVAFKVTHFGLGLVVLRFLTLAVRLPTDSNPQIPAKARGCLIPLSR